MARSRRRRRPVAGMVLASVLASVLAISVGLGLWSPIGRLAVRDAAAASLPAWHGGIDLYRRGTFTTQRSWLWCTAADVQIIRNIVRHQRDHSTTSQRRYFEWMRGHNRYRLPLSAGVDPAGWTAGLRHFVDSRYRLVASRSFASALRSAVTNLRRTNLPVGMTVSHGNHAWILTGFTATADPLRTSSFTVTSVRVVGPLFGLQSRNGYDMPPDTRLTPSQLRRFFTGWWYAPKRMIWDRRFVSIQAIPIRATPAAPAATPKPSSPRASQASAASAAPPSAPAAPPSVVASPAQVTAAATRPTAAPSPSPVAAIEPASVPTDTGGPSPGQAMVILTVGLAIAVMAVGIGRSIARSRPAPRLRNDR